MISLILLGSFWGAISGSIWGFALQAPAISVAATYGSIAGGVVALLVGGFGAMASHGGRVNRQESLFVSRSFISLIAMVSIAVGIVAGIVRWLFF